MEIKKAVITAAGTQQRTLPLQTVVDADGLNILSDIPDWHKLLPPETILTPHPGEMARLTGKTTAEVQADRLRIAQTSAAAWGHVVVLKGAFTVIAAPDGRSVLLPFANPGLASAGTGEIQGVPEPGAMVLLALGNRSNTRLKPGCASLILLIGIFQLIAFGLALIPLDVSDAFGGYRIYGSVAHFLSGLGWAALGWTFWQEKAVIPAAAG